MKTTEQAAQHTPGKWRVRDRVELLGTLSYATFHPFMVEDPDELGEYMLCANREQAHLIAAAPDMREALDGVTSLCNAINELIADDEDLRARVMVLFIAHGLRDDYGYKVAQAIAKAEGRS